MSEHKGDITPADAAYDERNRLVGYLSSQYPAHLTSDPVEPDWPVVCIHTPKGQMAWHIPLEAVGYFTHLSFEDNDWDGHTTQEKYKRLLRLYSNLVDSAQPKPNNHKESE